MNFIRAHRGYRRLIIGQLCILVALIVTLQWSRQFWPSWTGDNAFRFAKERGLANGERLNPNTATAEEWQALPGIGPALAERILLYRRNSGTLTAPRDLRNVRGLGPHRVGMISPYLDFSSGLDKNTPRDVDLVQ